MVENHKTVVVIGAGISGLCTAYFLQQSGVHVIVLEKDRAPGGTMKTIHDKGWLVETGPNSTLETTPLFQKLFDDLGIIDQRIYANDAANKRYIVRNEKLYPLPTGAIQFFTSQLWTSAGKFRLLKEPFIGRARKEESIAEFVERRLGKEFLDYAVNPFVAGVYAGDPEALSVRYAIPKVYTLEERYGGLVKGMVKGRNERKRRAEKAKDRAKLFSFINGMEILPKAIARRLEQNIKYETAVEHIIPMRAGRFPIYTVAYLQDNKRHTIEANAVVLSAPAHAISKIITPIDPNMASVLNSIYYPPVAEVFLGFHKSQVARELDGFGFLVPEVEQRKILGSIWSSTIFPNRAPKDHVAFTSFIGGARQPSLVSFSDEELTAIALHELQSFVGVSGIPTYSKIIRWEKAIPQYNIGYKNILDAMDRFEQNFQGSYFCSNFSGGISVGDCVMSSEKTVEKVKRHLILH